MVEDIKSLFTEKLVPTLIVLGTGLILGVVVGVFTPVKKIFKRKKY